MKKCFFCEIEVFRQEEDQISDRQKTEKDGR